MQKLQFSQNSTAAMRQDFSDALKIMTKAQKESDPEVLKTLGTVMMSTTAIGALKQQFDSMVTQGGISTTPKQRGTATNTNDLIATPTGYGDRILLAGEDTFALNNDDTVIAGTNLFPNAPTGGSNMAAKIDELIAEIRNQTRILSKRDNTFGAGINSAYYG